jgi:hypothetical protein
LTPISRPKSRHEFDHHWIAAPMGFSSAPLSSEILSIAHHAVRRS